MAIKILVVDDSTVMRNMIKKTIHLCGIDVNHIYEAGNGKEGLQVLKEEGVDLLFIDINMPIMDGMEMLGKVRQQKSTQHLPVLIVSTESNEGRIKDINQKGAGFVHKPFTPENLRKEMVGIMEKERNIKA